MAPKGDIARITMSVCTQQCMAVFWVRKRYTTCDMWMLIYTWNYANRSYEYPAIISPRQILSHYQLRILLWPYIQYLNDDTISYCSSFSVMNPTRLVYPFGRGSSDLSKKRLSISEKTWLRHEVKFHGKTASELGAKYSLNRKMITQWVASYTKNGLLQQSRGRPSFFCQLTWSTLRRVYQRRFTTPKQRISELRCKQSMWRTSSVSLE